MSGLCLSLSELFFRHNHLRQLQHHLQLPLLLPVQLSGRLSLDLLLLSLVSVHSVQFSLQHLLWGWQPVLPHLSHRLPPAQQRVLCHLSRRVLQPQQPMSGLHIALSSLCGTGHCGLFELHFWAVFAGVCLRQ